jgi:hypothetical protein
MSSCGGLIIDVEFTYIPKRSKFHIKEIEEMKVEIEKRKLCRNCRGSGCEICEDGLEK